MHVTLGAAARQSGLSKSTISRAIRDGKLSAIRSPDTGSYKIEQSELARYLEATAVVRATAETGVPADATDALRASVNDLRGMLADMTAQRDAWQRMAEAVQRQLPALLGKHS